MEEAIITAPSSSVPTTTRPATLMSHNPALVTLALTLRHLAKLQLIIKKQSQLDQLDRYFKSKIDALKDKQMKH